MNYEAVIGLEVHIQVRTRTKMFCACPNQYGGEPNTRVCPVCLGYPGVMPVINREAVRKTILAGSMCRCEIASYSKFDRKNYFYPDMPKNYQISQYDLPLCGRGSLPVSGNGFSGADLPDKVIGITRIHLEEDVAKSTHYGYYSAIDFNRAGVPLMECVSEPDMRTPDEAYAYLTALKQIMQYADISDCDMEKGQMRCDVNISVRPIDDPAFGTKIEIKNLNSFRAVHRALAYEIDRQADVLDSGGKLRQETRRWDDNAGVTSVMRTKESAHDYRYFPEPDLMPLDITPAWLEKIREDMPELPAERRRRFVTEYGITDYDADILTQDRNLADYFESVAAESPDAKMAANWIMTELLSALSKTSVPVSASPVTPDALAELLRLIGDGTISGKIGKTIFAEMLETGHSPRRIVKEKGLEQVADTGAIEAFVDRAISENPDAVEQYHGGKSKALQYLVGQVMRMSRGKANPQMVVENLKTKLD